MSLFAIHEGLPCWFLYKMPIPQSLAIQKYKYANEHYSYHQRWAEQRQNKMFTHILTERLLHNKNYG